MKILKALLFTTLAALTVSLYAANIQYTLFAEGPSANTSAYYQNFAKFINKASASGSPLPINRLVIRIEDPTLYKTDFSEACAGKGSTSGCGAFFTQFIAHLKITNPHFQLYAYPGLSDGSQWTWQTSMQWVKTANQIIKTHYKNAPLFTGIGYDMQSAGTPANPINAKAMKAYMSSIGLGGLQLGWTRSARGDNPKLLASGLNQIFMEIYDTYTNKSICPPGKNDQPTTTCPTKYIYVDASSNKSGQPGYAPNQQVGQPGANTIYNIALKNNPKNPAAALIAGKTQNPAGMNFSYLLNNVWAGINLSKMPGSGVVPMFSTEKACNKLSCGCVNNVYGTENCGSIDAFGNGWTLAQFIAFTQQFAAHYFPNSGTIEMGVYQYNMLPKTWVTDILSH